MGQVTRGYAAAATALLLLSGASSFGKFIELDSAASVVKIVVIEEGRNMSSRKE